MTHPADRLSAYLDGELGADEAAGVVAHLGGCEPCRRELADVVEARASVRGLPMLDLPADLGPDSAAVGARRRVRTWVGVAAAAAAIAVAVALGAPETVPVADLLGPHTELAQLGAAGVAP